MTKQITRISVVQTSKVVAVLYALISLLYTLVGIPMVVFGRAQFKVMGIIYMLMPILMLVLGFIFMAIFCALYNLVAKWLGGVEVTVQDT